MRTVAFCEIDEFCQRVLRKHWPRVPIHGDIKTLRGDAFGPIDLVCGGFPCQPYSTAGKRRGAEDDRHLWPEMLRVIAESRPAWVIGENTPNVIGMAFDEIAAGLEGIGYEVAEPLVIPACAVHGDHVRARAWIIANAATPRQLRADELENDCQDSDDRRRLDVAPLDSLDAQGRRRYPAPRTTEPVLLRSDHGVPYRVDRIGALGNAVIPVIPEIIGRAIVAAVGRTIQR